MNPSFVPEHQREEMRVTEEAGALTHTHRDVSPPTSYSNANEVTNLHRLGRRPGSRGRHVCWRGGGDEGGLFLGTSLCLSREREGREMEERIWHGTLERH